jgi:hypothetical protein
LKIIKNIKVDLLLKIIFFLFSAIITVLLIPGPGKFRYEFQKGEPWKHETLIADFDFPVYKSDEFIKAEKDSILENVKPYYIYQEDAFSDIQKFFNEEMDRIIDLLIYGEKEFDKKYKINIFNEFIKRKFDEKIENIYSKGILQTIPETEGFKLSTGDIFKVKDNIAQLTDIQDVYTEKTAYIELQTYFRKLKTTIKYEVFEPDYSKLIKANLIYDEVTTLKLLERMMNEISPV